MAEKKKGGRWLLILLVLVVLGSLACCCGCAGLWHFMPHMLVQTFTEDGPLKAPVVDPDPAVAPRLERAFEAGGPVAITGQEMVQLVEPWDDDEISTFWVDVDDEDRMEFALSVWFEEIDRFLNVQTTGTLEIEHGWFTDLTIDELEVSGWDLGQYVLGQQLAEHANRSAADQRAQDPHIADAMDQIDHLWIDDGALWIELAPGGWEAWERSAR